MGQMTYGLCYGVPGAAFVQCSDMDSVDRLLTEYSDARHKDIDRLAKKTDHYLAGRRIVPVMECDSKPPFIGFFIAAGASGKEGVPDLDSFRLDRIDTDKRYRAAMKAAGNAWAKFADWCERAKGIKLPEPNIWLIETEVA